MKQILLFSFMLVLLFHIGNAVGMDCKTSSDFAKDVPFLKFFDECLVDTTHLKILGNAALLLQTWFNTDTYPIYIMIVIFLIPHLFFTDEIANDDAARGNCMRLRGYVLLMKIGLVITVVPWLWASFRQERPCVCKDDKGEYVPLNPNSWGMPSEGAFASSVIGLHVAEAVSFPLGIIFILIMATEGLLVGDYSIGQVIVGIAFGVAYHMYSSHTYIYFRILDLLLSVVAGVIALLVTKHQYPVGLDFSFSVEFLVGLVWQLYALSLIIVTFDFGFVKEAFRRTTRNLHEVDFLYYRSLNAPPAGEDRAQLPHEAIFLTLVTTLLFITLCALRISTPYIDNLLSIV